MTMSLPGKRSSSDPVLGARVPEVQVRVEHEVLRAVLIVRVDPLRGRLQVEADVLGGVLRVGEEDDRLVERHQSTA